MRIKQASRREANTKEGALVWVRAMTFDGAQVVRMSYEDGKYIVKGYWYK